MQLKTGLGLCLREVLAWFCCAAFIFSLLYGSSYLALLWLPPIKAVDTRSLMAANYSPWSDIAFQPVDHGILVEIQRERGLPDQLIVEGSFWPTPTSGGEHSPEGEEKHSFQATSTSPAQISNPRITSSGVTPFPIETLPVETEVLPIINPTPLLNQTETPQAINSPKPEATLQSVVTPTPTMTPKPAEPTKRPKPTKNVPPPKRTPSP